MAAKAGRLQIQLELEVAQLRRDLDAVNAQMNRAANDWKNSFSGFKDVFTGMFAADAAMEALNTLGSAIKDIVKSLGDIADEANKLRDTPENFQKLAFAAQQSGVAMEDVVKAAGKLQTSLGQIAQGDNKKAAEALDALGISLKDLKDLSPAQAFEKVGGAIGTVTDASKQAAAGAALIGKGWQSTLPLIAQGEQGMKQLGEQAKVATDAAVYAADTFGDTLDAMHGAVRAFLGEAMAPLLDGLTGLIGQLEATTANVSDVQTSFSVWQVACKSLVTVITAVVQIIGDMVAAVEAVGQGIGVFAGAAVEGFEAVGKAAAIAMDPAKWFDPAAYAEVGNKLESTFSNMTASLDDISKEFGRRFKANADAAGTAIDQAWRGVPKAAPPPTATTGDTQTGRDAAAAAEAAKKAAQAKAAAEREAAKAAKEYADAVKELNKFQQDQAEGTQKVIDANIDYAAAVKIANGENEDAVAIWALQQKGADAYAITLAQIQQDTAKVSKAHDEATAHLDEMKDAQIELREEQMRATGATEEYIKAWDALARGLDSAQVAARDAHEQTQKLRTEQEIAAQNAADTANIIAGGVSDIFTSMTEGAEAAEKAILRLIAQLLAAIVTQKILNATGLAKYAKGGAFSGGVQLFAQGGIVGSPTAFAFANGRMGVMGEAGPEAIMPLKRGPDGKLGVSGGTTVQVFNYAGADISAEQDEDRVRIVVDRVRATIAGDISRGGNPVAAALERAYSVRR